MPDPSEAPKSHDVHHDQIASPLDIPEVSAPTHVEVDNPKSKDMGEGINTDRPVVKGESAPSNDQSKPEGGPWGHDKAEDIAAAVKKEYRGNSGRMDTYDSFRKLAPRDQGSRFQEAVNKQLKLPEELYDANPDLFAEMSTKQFLKTLGEFQSVEKKALKIEDQVEVYRARQQDCETALESGALSWKNFSRDFDSYTDGDPREKLLSLPLDSTPRQTLEDIRDEFAQMITDKEAELSGARSELEAFLDEQRARKK